MVAEGIIVVLIIVAFDVIIIAAGKHLKKLNAWFNTSAKSRNKDRESSEG